MKRISGIIISLLAFNLSFAQVIQLRPETNSGGKFLSQEDANIVASAYPERINLKDIPEFESKAGEPEWKAYSQGGSLYVKGPQGSRCIALSEKPGIVYGESVSRNEFGINGGIFPSNDGKSIAFYRKDERRVSTFPLLDINTRTGSLKQIAYPMNGMPSEHISVGVYHCGTGERAWLEVNDFSEERYITNLSWSASDKYIYAQILDREQHNMHLNMYRADNGKFVRTILEEHDEKWQEPLDPCYVLPGREDIFIYRTNQRDGYRNLYLVDTLGAVRRLTCVDADVEFVSADADYVYYTSAELSPVENHLYRIKVGRKGKFSKLKISETTLLTPERGWHNVNFSPDGRYFVDSYSSFSVPRVVNLCRKDGKIVRNLLTAENPLKNYAQCEVEFGKIPSADGKFDNYYRLYKPLHFDPAKKYPLVVYVYGGPHSQMVQDKWLANTRLWEMYMAQRGYVVYVQDNRGTQNRGKEFEQAINRRCGQEEMADQMIGVRRLLENPWVDAERVGVHGWSYGGFMTISLMTTYPEIFKVGVAGGPVIDWKWYEAMYGERYMDTEESNPEGFSQTSLMNQVKNLQGKLLICQGAIDNTVLWLHSLSFTQKCIEEGIALDYFPYPCSEHNVFGKWRVHLMDKVSEYFVNNL